MQKLLFLSIILLALSACSLGDEPAGEIQLTIVPLENTATSEPTISVTHTSTANFTPLPTSFAPQATSTATPVSIRNTSNCTVRSDLASYQVVAGDSLSNIASRYNTTTTQLAQFNCLTDANLISVGMILRVPIQATATATLTPIGTPTPVASPTITSLGVRGTLGVYPVISSGRVSNWTDYVVEAQTPFTVNWTGIEPEYYDDIVSVAFFYRDDYGAVTEIGIDNDISDGMSITWTPPAGISGTITGDARTVNNGFWTSSTLHVREPDAVIEHHGGCRFVLSGVANAYTEKDAESTIVVSEIPAGTSYIILDLTIDNSITYIRAEVSDGIDGWFLGSDGSVNCPGQ